MLPRLLLATVLLSLLAVGTASAAGLDDAGYWAVADRLQPAIDRFWNEQAGRYDGTLAGANANALLTNAVAALRGHHGPARNDRRARRLVDALVSSPPFVSDPSLPLRDSQTHVPGFVASMTRVHSHQHMIFDTEVVDGLRYAWLARRQLGLTERQSAAIADRIHRIAMGSYYRWPTIRLNQINWYALMYAADATVTGNPYLLRHDLWLQIARFVALAHGTAGAAGNLGAGLQFHYLPTARASDPMNVDSAEYANITASFLREYGQARRSGMRAPSPAARRLLRRWLLRVLAGYWTHAGYMNWDTGYGFRRWHQVKKFGLSQQALLGIAATPALAPTRKAPAWAKWLFDRGLAFYERQLAHSGAHPPGLFFGVHVLPQDGASSRLALTRVQSNAARAVFAGLGKARAQEPPSLYSYDPDTGRLAVSTRAYNTAVVPTSRGAYPYGGIELARLYDGDQEVAGGIGGRPPASFGMLVRDISGRRVFASQLPDRGRLRLTRAPHGVHAHATVWTGRAYAGAFTDLRAAGVARGPGLIARTSHRFTRAFVETAWSLRRGGGRARHSVDVLFPSWGRGAEVTAVLRDGTTREVGTTRLPLASIAYLQVRSRYGGYVVVPRARPAGATVHLLNVRPQSSAPEPGPTLAVQLVRAARFRVARFAARVAPARPQSAAALAARVASAP